MAIELMDKNDVKIINGSIVDIHQTVNGEHIFVVLDIENLDIRYGCDLNYEYEYNKEELLVVAEGFPWVDTAIEVVGNIYTEINKYRN